MLMGFHSAYCGSSTAYRPAETPKIFLELPVIGQDAKQGELLVIVDVPEIMVLHRSQPYRHRKTGSMTRQDQELLGLQKELVARPRRHNVTAK
jgi:hypothetical protein